MSELNGFMKRILVLLTLVLSGYLPAQNASLYLHKMQDTSLPFIRGLEWAKEIRAFSEEMPHDLSVRFLFGDTNHAFVNCMSDWYIIKDGHWKNQYKLFSHGFTCSARLFFRNGYPVLYGGYGIWRGQSLNIRFVESGEWEMVQSPTIPDYLIAGPAFHYNDTSVIILPGSVVNITSRESFEQVGYIVHPSGSWEPVKFDRNGDPLLVPKGRIMQELISDDYRIYIGRGGKGRLLSIQDKQSGNIYQTSFEYASPSESSYLRGDTLYLIGARNTAYYIPNLIKRRDLLTISNVHAGPSPSTYLLVGGFVLLIVFVLIILFRSRRSPIVIREKEELPDFYNSLLDLSGKGLTNEELNELFALNDLTYDMIRKRRSIILKEVNSYHEERAGKPLVVRQPNPEDKRQFIYHIKK